MITMTPLAWYAAGLASSLMPSLAVVLILIRHARRTSPVRESTDADRATWQQRVACPCPRCGNTIRRPLGRRAASERQIELNAPSEQMETEG